MPTNAKLSLCLPESIPAILILSTHACVEKPVGEPKPASLVAYQNLAPQALQDE